MKTLLRSSLAIVLFSITSVANAGLIEIFSDGSNITSLAAADALIASTAPITTGSVFLVDYNDGGDGNGGHYFGLDNPWPGGVVSNFVARITGSFIGPAGALADFRISHDDGVRMIINGNMVEFPGLTDDRDTFLNGLTLSAVNTVQIVFFEHLGGASLEFAARCSSSQPALDCTNTNFFLLGLDDPIDVPEPGTLALLGIGLFGMGVARRRKTV
jgi:hypothetical protein